MNTIYDDGDPARIWRLIGSEVRILFWQQSNTDVYNNYNNNNIFSGLLPWRLTLRHLACRRHGSHRELTMNNMDTDILTF